VLKSNEILGKLKKVTFKAN